MRKPLPHWCEKTLQGLSFWIGYRNSYFYSYPLTEGAIIAETCSMIFSHLHEKEKLLCEVMYKNIAPIGNDKYKYSKERADLVIIESNGKYTRKSNLSKVVKCIIEVKRSESRKFLIYEDIKRLYSTLEKNNRNDLRAFLIIVSQSKAPKYLLTDDGKARRNIHNFSKNISCAVRRVCKATSTFKKNINANYALIIEVFRSNQKS